VLAELRAIVVSQRAYYPVCNIQYAHRAEISVNFMSVHRQVLGGNSTKLARLVTVTLHFYTV